MLFVFPTTRCDRKSAKRYCNHRDAMLTCSFQLSSAYMSLSSSIDKAVKAYIDHTNVILAGDASLNVSYLQQPFDQLAHASHIAQQAFNLASGSGQANGAATAAGAEEPRKKRPYKPRDPNAPKRPLTAYFRYLQEQRGPLGEEMKQAAGGVPQKPGDLSKEATERWNKLSKQEQQPYRDAYQHALKDYEKQVKKYKTEQGGLVDPQVDGGDEDDEAEVPGEVDAEHDKDDEDDDDEESSDEESSEDDEPVPPPPPPPKQKTPKTKKTKSAAVPPTPSDSNIDPALSGAVAKISSSPERKRKAADGVAESAKKAKKSRKSAVAETPAAPVAPMQPQVPETEKKKKRKKKSDDA